MSPTTLTRRTRRQVENLQGQVKNLQKGKGGGKSAKGHQGTSASSRSVVWMPSELIGQHAMTEENQPICFSFNSSGCKACKVNEKRARGWHVCTRCRGAHSQRNPDLRRPHQKAFHRTSILPVLHCMPLVSLNNSQVVRNCQPLWRLVVSRSLQWICGAALNLMNKETVCFFPTTLCGVLVFDSVSRV